MVDVLSEARNALVSGGNSSGALSPCVFAVRFKDHRQDARHEDPQRFSANPSKTNALQKRKKSICGSETAVTLLGNGNFESPPPARGEFPETPGGGWHHRAPTDDRSGLAFSYHLAGRTMRMSRIAPFEYHARPEENSGAADVNSLALVPMRLAALAIHQGNLKWEPRRTRRVISTIVPSLVSHIRTSLLEPTRNSGARCWE